jgi:hypothetical protein
MLFANNCDSPENTDDTAVLTPERHRARFSNIRPPFNITRQPYSKPPGVPRRGEKITTAKQIRTSGNHDGLRRT